MWSNYAVLWLSLHGSHWQTNSLIDYVLILYFCLLSLKVASFHYNFAQCTWRLHWVLWGREGVNIHRGVIFDYLLLFWALFPSLNIPQWSFWLLFVVVLVKNVLVPLNFLWCSWECEMEQTGTTWWRRATAWFPLKGQEFLARDSSLSTVCFWIHSKTKPMHFFFCIFGPAKINLLLGISFK